MASSDYLPFEPFVRKHLLHNHLSSLIYWCLGEIPFGLGLLWLVEHRPFEAVVRDYLISLVIGTLASNGNIVLLLYASDRIRALRPFFERITANKLMVKRINKEVFYRRAPIYICTVVSIALGFTTFGVLGLRTPKSGAIVVYVGLFFVFGFLGMTIGWITNLWRFFLLLGSFLTKVDTTHPDRMGGLKPIGDLNSVLLYIGAGLVALYSMGAQFSPYAHGDLKKYAYLWVVMAVGLFGVGIFLPTYTIHHVLLAAKDEQENRLSLVKARLLQSFESTANTLSSAGTIKEIKLAIDAFKYFESDLERMSTWPYNNIWKMLARAFSIQVVASLIGSWDTVAKIVTKLAQ